MVLLARATPLRKKTQLISVLGNNRSGRPTAAWEGVEINNRERELLMLLLCLGRPGFGALSLGICEIINMQ